MWAAYGAASRMGRPPVPVARPVRRRRSPVSPDARPARGLPGWHRHPGQAVVRPAGHPRRCGRRCQAGRRCRLRRQLRLERLHALRQAGSRAAARTAAGHRAAPAVPAGRGSRVEGHRPQCREAGDMLRRLTAVAGLALAAALLLTAVAHSSALADGNPDPGTAGPFGAVQCGQSYTPGCTVTAGSPETEGTGQGRAATAVGTQGPTFRAAASRSSRPRGPNETGKASC
jgi:hypothetical protein